MTQEDKDLLLKDLCARLPYNCRVFYEYVDDLDGKTYGYSLTLNTWCIDELVANKAVIKPYLRPMSSMTEEEKKELQEIAVALSYNKDDIMIGTQINSFRQLDGVLDLFNSHHLDWRGLIEKGLALEAPEGMYNIKEK